NGHLRLEHFQQVPADGLPLAVLVRRDVEFVGLLERVLQLLDDLPLVGGDDVERREALLHVDAEAGPLLLLQRRRDLRGRRRQVAHVPHARLDPVLGRQEPADGAGFRGGLDDDEALHQGAVATGSEGDQMARAAREDRTARCGSYYRAVRAAVPALSASASAATRYPPRPRR